MDEEFVVEYFRNIATKLKELSHTPESPSFYYIKNMTDMGAVAALISTFNDAPVMLLENHEGGISSEHGDNDFEKVYGAFTILLQATDNDEKNEFKELFSLCHSIAKKIFSKMQADRIAGRLDFFDFQLNYMKLGPVSDNRYGRRYEFSIGRSIEILFDEEDWIA